MSASSGARSRPVRQRVDRGVAARAGDLHQAQLREVGAIAHELGIERDEGLLRQLVAEFRQFLSLGQQGHAWLAFRRGAPA